MTTRAQWFVILAAAVLLAVHLRDRLFVDKLEGWDAEVYYKMASSTPLEPVMAPFAYRWLPHKAVAFVPLQPKRTYELVTWSCLVLATFYMAKLLERTGLGPGICLAIAIGCLLWAKYGGRFYVWYRAGTDPLAYLFLVGGWLAILRSSLGALAAIGLVGVACREYTLLLFPTYALWNGVSVNRGWGQLQVDTRTIAKTCLAAVPAIALFVVIRKITPVTNHYSLLEVALDSLRTKLLTVDGVLKTLSSALAHNGVVVPFLLVYWKETRAALRTYPAAGLWCAMTFGLGLIGGTDTERLMAYGLFGECFIFAMVLLKLGPIEKLVPTLAVAALFHLVIAQTFDLTHTSANVTPVRPLLEAVLALAALAFAKRPLPRPQPTRSPF
jgi:hypothetical protein